MFFSCHCLLSFLSSCRTSNAGSKMSLYTENVFYCAMVCHFLFGPKVQPTSKGFDKKQKWFTLVWIKGIYSFGPTTVFAPVFQIFWFGFNRNFNEVNYVFLMSFICCLQSVYADINIYNIHCICKVTNLQVLV